jgi:flagellum-specific peptidoglycan hydrolase FlgJ
MLAIAYHESGGGNSRTAKLLNNHFGIVGPNNLKKTHNITSRYKQYTSVTDSYFGFCKLISSKSFFSQLKGTTDVAKWVNSIASSGYAGSSKAWAEKIKWIIKNYSLK